MHENQPIPVLEQFEGDLSVSEQAVLAGVAYGSLERSFTASRLSFEICTEVWSYFLRYKNSSTPLKLRKRLVEHYTPLAAAGDLNAQRHLQNSRRPFKRTVEFGKQVYHVDGKLIFGAVHSGGSKTIQLQRNLDGIPDALCVIQVHSHPEDSTFSLADVITVLTEDVRVPHRCLYYVVGPTMIHLLFPTKETKRKPAAILRGEVYKDQAGRYEKALEFGAGKMAAQLELIAETAAYYKLGFYIGNKDLTMTQYS